MARIDDMLRHMKELDGSDLHLVAGISPRIRSHGELVEVEGWPELTDESVREIAREIATELDWQRFEECGDLDFAYGLEGVARFRANYFVQERGAGAVFRIIPEEILTLEDLKLPAAVESLCHLNQGLVLITGPTGSGKSTTLAAVINQINHTYARHIVTIENPVEFVHQNQSSILSHREVGSHTLGFTPALRASIRQDADVVLVGEMRDTETIALAITAAEMGMLVFGTLHTNSAVKTVDRIVDAFPADEQNQIRVSLSESLSGVVSQLLLRTADGKGRCAVHEILLKSTGLANVIREGNTPMLNSLIQSGKSQGMLSMDDSLFAAVESGQVRAVDARRKATEKARFDPLVTKEQSNR
jgi:twitching motility protein PilT